MMITLIFALWLWGLVFLWAAIPGAIIGWVASAMLGYKRGIVISTLVSIGAAIIAVHSPLPFAYLYFPPFLAAGLLGVWICRRTLRVQRWLVLAIIPVLLVAYGGPLLLTYVANSEQDECSFGPVSNAQYRDYLRRANELSKKTPGSFSSNQIEAIARFDGLFEALIEGSPSVYERVAASHALLRSFGAQYRNTSDKRADPYATVAKKGGFVSFRYYLDINRLGVALFHPFLLLGRTTYITVNLSGPGDLHRGPFPTTTGDIRFSVNFPVFDARISYDRASENCPLVPSQALSERFSRTKN